MEVTLTKQEQEQYPLTRIATRIIKISFREIGTGNIEVIAYKGTKGGTLKECHRSYEPLEKSQTIRTMLIANAVKEGYRKD